MSKSTLRSNADPLIVLWLLIFFLFNWFPWMTLSLDLLTFLAPRSVKPWDYWSSEAITVLESLTLRSLWLIRSLYRYILSKTCLTCSSFLTFDSSLPLIWLMSRTSYIISYWLTSPASVSVSIPCIFRSFTLCFSFVVPGLRSLASSSSTMLSLIAYGSAVYL